MLGEIDLLRQESSSAFYAWQFFFNAHVQLFKIMNKKKSNYEMFLFKLKQYYRGEERNAA